LAVPDTVVLDALALALADEAAAVAEDDVAGAEDEDEDDEDELQAAAARPRHAMPSTAATRRLEDRSVGMLSTLAITTCVPQEDLTPLLRTVTCYVPSRVTGRGRAGPRAQAQRTGFVIEVTPQLTGPPAGRMMTPKLCCFLPGEGIA
jgi:hypothetical protein